MYYRKFSVVYKKVLKFKHEKNMWWNNELMSEIKQRTYICHWIRIIDMIYILLNIWSSAYITNHMYYAVVYM